MRQLLSLGAFLLTPALLPAEIILDDAMNRSARTAPPDAQGAQWLAIGPATANNTTYSPFELKLATGTGGGQLLGYFTPASAPIRLEIGQTITVSFTFSLTGGLGASAGDPAADTTLRFGLFNSGGVRIASDITTLSSSSNFVAYTGHAAMMSLGTGGISLRTRIPDAGTNQNNLIGTATNVYAAAHATGASQALAADVDYTGTLTATRTADGVEVGFALEAEGWADYRIGFRDETSSVVNFDAFAVGWAPNALAAGGAFVLRSLSVDAPVPAPPGGDDVKPTTVRPFIWVRPAEQAALLAKISGQAWAGSVFNALVNRAATHVASHQANRDAFLRQLPVTWSEATPKFKTMPSYASSEVRTPAEAKFNQALDAAVLYYLTADEQYARLAADVLHNAIKTLLPVSSSTSTSNGGWIIQNDLLLEARVVGTQLPMVYDFIQGFLRMNQVYDVQTAAMVDFNFTNAQSVFRRYYQLTRDHGSRESNWSALMATCMLNNLLALEDAAERSAALQVYLTKGGTRQASLSYDYRHFPAPGSIWPESLQYSLEVVEVRSAHLVLLERYDPSLNLFAAYPNYPRSLTRIAHLRYPNGQLILFGDGPRTGGEPYFFYELIYQHAKARGHADLAALFGGRINDGVSLGRYNRSTLPGYESLGLHNELLHLLWSAETVAEAAQPMVYPRTDRVPHAGIALQRNPSPTNNSLYGLMGFVGGAGHIHSHASGMGMELFGLGQVLGAKSGKTTYGETINENYYRVYAANNTVIVNGASRGMGGWGNFGINTVAVAALEPAVGAAAVSPHHSFSTSTFRDNKGTLTDATQQRTLGLVRTSPTTGYYVDIFRSDSALAGEYHDYIYRNISDSVTLTANGAALPLASAPTRFQSDIGDANQQPGWRYFTNTEVSAATSATVRAVFSASLPAGQTHMQMLMPGVTGGREYARVSSPPLTTAPSPYATRNAPTLVIRKQGSAWEQPFAAVYEPYLGTADSGSVRAVSKLEQNGVVVGLKVESTVGSRHIVQYVISHPNATDTYTDSAVGLSFNGRYAVATDHGDGSGSLYLGQGTRLTFKSYTMFSPSGANAQGYLEFAAGQPPVLNAGATVNWTYAGSKQSQTITFPELADRPWLIGPFQPGASASSGLPVAYAVVAGPATSEGNTVTFTGVGTVTLRATQVGNDAYEAAAPVERTFEILPSFASWLGENFTSTELQQPAVSGPQAVLTADGLPNLLKYALGLDPKVPAHNSVPAVAVEPTEWVVHFDRPASRVDVTYGIETSPNLVDWTPVPVALVLLREQDGRQTWQVRVPRMGSTPAFFRLSVVR